VQWNERQKEKQQQVERLKSQLEDQQKRLEDMQEQARKQGYGTSVYDP
jgi:predicted ribosome quality control (RQC) complex YloA/Tae2 family protein